MRGRIINSGINCSRLTSSISCWSGSRRLCHLVPLPHEWCQNVMCRHLENSSRHLNECHLCGSLLQVTFPGARKGPRHRYKLHRSTRNYRVRSPRDTKRSSRLRSRNIIYGFDLAQPVWPRQEATYLKTHISIRHFLFLVCGKHPSPGRPRRQHRSFCQPRARTFDAGAARRRTLRVP